jgi:ActR/RegA family two-component response regulator
MQLLRHAFLWCFSNKIMLIIRPAVANPMSLACSAPGCQSAGDPSDDLCQNGNGLVGKSPMAPGWSGRLGPRKLGLTANASLRPAPERRVGGSDKERTRFSREKSPAAIVEPATPVYTRDMLLSALLVADPQKQVADLLAQQCGRMAARTIVAISGDRVIAEAKAQPIEMMVMSLEIQRPGPLEVVEAVEQLRPSPFVVVSYRELGVPTMERYSRLGITDFVAQPIDATDIYRAASRHFNMPFRRHDRFAVAIDVTRPDGVTIGRTRDLSEGGLLMDAFYPATAGESWLIQLALPDQKKPLRVRIQILQVDGIAPAPMVARAQFQRLRGEEHRRLVTFLAAQSSN